MSVIAVGEWFPILGALQWSAISPALLIASTLRLGTPLAYVALGETFAQRSGVINIGIEGVMLSACCIAAAASLTTGSVITGFIAAVLGGMAIMAVIAALVLVLKADQIVVGVGVNLTAIGLTTVAAKRAPDLNNVNALRVWRIPGLKDLPVLGKMLFQQKAVVYLVVFVAMACAFALNRTAWGLRVKAAGETPGAADAAGIVVNRVRLQAMIVCGGLAGFGGAAYALGTTQGFSENMVAGRGFIALVAVIFGRWRPVPVLLGCGVFALFEASSLAAPGWGVTIPSQLLNVAPFVASLVALVVLRKGASPPSALSLPFERRR